MSSPASSKPPTGTIAKRDRQPSAELVPKPPRIRFRHVLDASDPARIRALIAATGVFSAEEARVAAELADTTLDGTETYRWLLAAADGELLGYTGRR